MTSTPKRRWHQFSLRMLLVVITLLCLGPGGYVVYEQRNAREQMAAVLAIENLGSLVIYDDQAPVRSTIMRKILGDESFGNVTAVHLGAQANDASLVYLSPLTKLRRVDLQGTQVTDAGLAQLASQKKLEYVSLEETKVTVAGVVGLQKVLPNCFIDHSLFESIERELGLEYLPPAVPAPEHPPGDNSVDLKKLYLAVHRYGWNMAIDDWIKWREFRYKSKEDVSEASFVGVDGAVWLGYSEAKRQIEEKTNDVTP